MEYIKYVIHFLGYKSNGWQRCQCALQVIRVKWSLHAREEIVFELHQHLRGNETRALLDGIRKSTRDMISEQEAVRSRLFTIQDAMQGTVRAWLQVYFSPLVMAGLMHCLNVAMLILWSANFAG